MFCQFCGAQNPDGASECAACGKPISIPSAVAAASAEAPESAVTPAAGERIARMGDRFLAVVLDTILIVAVFAVIGMAVAGWLGGTTESGFSLEGTPALLAIGVTSLIAFCYFWLCEGLFGATLGKGLVGIRIRQKEGGGCDLRCSFIRNILRLIDGIALYLVGFLVAILSKSRQRIGDHLAGTVVVEKKVGSLARAGLVLLWLVVVGGGLAGAYLLHQEPAAPEVATTAAPVAPEQPTQQPTAAASPAVNLTTTGAMKVANFDFLQREEGPSRPLSPYHPGDTVYVSYDVIDYSTDAEGRPQLSYNLAVLDPNGLLLDDAWTNEFNSKLPSGRPVHGTFSITLPLAVPAGTCRFVLKVRDELNGDELELTAPFEVDAPPIAPATSLKIRDFQLSLSEDGPGVIVPQLEDGGTLYMKCSVFGLRFRGDEAELRMGLRVTGPGGKVVFEEPNFEHIQDSWVYHPPTFYIPISGDLNIPSGFEKGVYTAVYTFTDLVADRTVTTEAKFTVG